MKFEEYFSFEAIVGDLVKWRIAGKDVGGTLPARKAWSRAGVKERKRKEGQKRKKPETLRRQAIWRTVKKCCQCGNVASSNVANNQLRWVQNLTRLVEEVQGAVFSGQVAFEAPTMFKIAKGREGGVMQYREVASFERLADRVILSRMTAYVRDRLEVVLGTCCYSFRKDRDVNHQLAVEHLQKFRARFLEGSLFAAECDIKKFFDNISHETVRRRWREVGFEDAAGKVLEAYLGVYAVGKADGHAGRVTLPDGVDCTRRGLPQGGSFSTVLANLVLAEADQAVQDVDDGQLFYARYCDDVVFVHPDEAMCRRAMEAYEAALAKLDLPMHEVRPFVYKPADGSPTEYYSIKSKGPFRWREVARGDANCAPWVSFLGSQVRYDGATRIRKESIEKHIRSLGRETAKAMREIKARGEKRRSRGARPANAAGWFARFRNRLIAKGVGYVTAKVKDCDMCWAGAFPNVTDCAETKMQMRRLDRVREGMLCKVWSLVAGECCSEGTRTFARRYKGRPFSYYGFLEEAMRPTNMARRSRISVLSYSEL